MKIAITVGTAPLKTHPAVIQRLSDPGSTWHQIFEVWDAPEIVRPGVPELPLLGSPARRSFTMFFHVLTIHGRQKNGVVTIKCFFLGM